MQALFSHLHLTTVPAEVSVQLCTGSVCSRSDRSLSALQTVYAADTYTRSFMQMPKLTGLPTLTSMNLYTSLLLMASHTCTQHAKTTHQPAVFCLDSGVAGTPQSDVSCAGVDFRASCFCHKVSAHHCSMHMR